MASEVSRTLWWSRAGERPPTALIASGSQYDIAIIGGGIAGLTAAWHLARTGRSVAVFEAGQIGEGASGVNAGFVVPNFAKADPAAVIARLGREQGEQLLALVGAGADRVFALARDHDIACEAEQTGWMHVAHTPDMADMLRRRAEAWQALGRPVRMLDRAEARARAALRHCEGAYFDPSGGMINPLAYTIGLARLANAAGTRLHENAQVRHVARDGALWTLTFETATVRAGQVILATNAAHAGVARRLYRRIVPLHVYQIATEPLSPAEAARISPFRNPVADTRGDLFTCRLDRDNRLISGAVPILPFAAHGRMSRMIAARLARELGLARPPAVAFAWTGTAAMTMDFLPHLYDFGPGFIGGIGCNGRGVALSTMLGDVLARAAINNSLRDLPVPVAPAHGIPLHFLARAAPSFAIAHARWTEKVR